MPQNPEPERLRDLSVHFEGIDTVREAVLQAAAEDGCSDVMLDADEVEALANTLRELRAIVAQNALVAEDETAGQVEPAGGWGSA